MLKPIAGGDKRWRGAVGAEPGGGLVDLQIEAYQGCPESRNEPETAVQEKLDLHNDTLGTYT